MLLSLSVCIHDNSRYYEISITMNNYGVSQQERKI